MGWQQCSLICTRTEKKCAALWLAAADQEAADDNSAENADCPLGERVDLYLIKSEPQQILGSFDFFQQPAQDLTESHFTSHSTGENPNGLSISIEASVYYKWFKMILASPDTKGVPIHIVTPYIWTLPK